MSNDSHKDNVVPHPALSKPTIQGNGIDKKSGGGGGEPPVEILARITKLESDLVRLESKLETSFLKQESLLAQLSANIDSKFSGVETKIAQAESSFIKWAVGFTLAIIGATFATVRFTNDQQTHQSPQSPQSQPPAPIIQIVPISVPTQIPSSTEPLKNSAPQNKSSNKKNK